MLNRIGLTLFKQSSFLIGAAVVGLMPAFTWGETPTTVPDTLAAEPTLETSPAATTPLPPSRSDWQFIFAPYFVAPSIEGTQSVGRVQGVDLDVSPHDIFQALDMGFMADIEVRKGRIGAVVNAAYMDLSGDERGPFGGKLDWNVKQWTVSNYITYRFPHEKGFIEPYIGARYWSIDMSMKLGGGILNLSKDDTEEWLDIFGGLRLKQQLTDKLSLLAQGDIGGFGWSSEFTWYALAGLGYDLNEHCMLVAGFSAIGVDYEKGHKGTSSYFEYDTITYGPLVGVVFRF